MKNTDHHSDSTLVFKKCFYLFWEQKNFCISIRTIRKLTKQLTHVLTHFLIALYRWDVSLAIAFTIEYKDGLVVGEGFNIFPDFVFRLLGIALAILVRFLLFDIL